MPYLHLILNTWKLHRFVRAATRFFRALATKTRSTSESLAASCRRCDTESWRFKLNGLNTDPDTTIHVSSSYRTCVLILLYLQLKRIEALASALAQDTGIYCTVLNTFTDSTEMLEKLDDALFLGLIDTLNKSQRARVVKLMEITCISNNMVVEKNQNRWVKMLFQDAPHLLWRVERVDGQVWLKDRSGSELPVSITDLYAKKAEIDIFCLGMGQYMGQDVTVPHQDENAADKSITRMAKTLRYHIKIMQLIEACCNCSTETVRGRNSHAMYVLLPLLVHVSHMSLDRH